VIACDGAAASLHSRGIAPDAIVGDLDSLPQELRRLYADRLHHIAEQESNDLTKAVRYAAGAGHREALILGATGLREDHTLGNISLLLDYAALMERIEMLTDYGLFTPVRHAAVFAAQPGSQVSIFAPRAGVRVSAGGLRWPLNDRSLDSWWQGSLNEATGSEFSLAVSGAGGAIVYRPLGPGKVQD
jgi:thiamine pyrophosphokinase